MKGILNTSSIRAKLSAWLLLAMVMVTVLPFNLLHSHETSDCISEEKWDDHQNCNHEFHIAEAQEACLLCHFVFVPTFQVQPSIYLEEIRLLCSVQNNIICDEGKGTTVVRLIHNKGSPEA